MGEEGTGVRIASDMPGHDDDAEIRSVVEDTTTSFPLTPAGCLTFGVAPGDV